MRKRYKAQISVNNKPVHIGFFHTKEEAVLAKQVTVRWYRKKLLREINAKVHESNRT